MNNSFWTIMAFVGGFLCGLMLGGLGVLGG